MSHKTKQSSNFKIKLQRSFDVIQRPSVSSHILDSSHLTKTHQTNRNPTPLTGRSKILSVTLLNKSKRSASEKVKRQSFDDGELFSDEILQLNESRILKRKDKVTSYVIPTRTELVNTKLQPMIVSTHDIVSKRYQNQSFKMLDIKEKSRFQQMRQFRRQMLVRQRRRPSLFVEHRRDPTISRIKPRPKQIVVNQIDRWQPLNPEVQSATIVAYAAQRANKFLSRNLKQQKTNQTKDQK